MKKLFFLPFLLFLLTSCQGKGENGFINRSEPNIKGFICGRELYIKVLRKNFSLEDIYTGEAQEKIALEFDLNNMPIPQGGYITNEENRNVLRWFYFDINGLNLYTIDKENSNAFVTYMILTPRKTYFGDRVYAETSFRRRDNLIISNINYYELDDNDESWVLIFNNEDTFNLSKLTVSYYLDDEKVIDNCLLFPLPGIIEVKN